MENKKVVCHVRLKDGVLDPQGVTIKHTLSNLGYNDVAEIRSGKVFEITFKDGTSGDLKKKSEEICSKLLANPVIENFEVAE